MRLIKQLVVALALLLAYAGAAVLLAVLWYNVEGVLVFLAIFMIAWILWLMAGYYLDGEE